MVGVVRTSDSARQREKLKKTHHWLYQLLVPYAARFSPLIEVRNFLLHLRDIVADPETDFCTRSGSTVYRT
jgi:hypothetical protein